MQSHDAEFSEHGRTPTPNWMSQAERERREEKRRQLLREEAFERPEYDPYNVIDAHERIAKLEEIVKQQSLMIDALVQAHRISHDELEEVHCLHDDYSELGTEQPNPNFNFSWCWDCMKNVAVVK